MKRSAITYLPAVLAAVLILMLSSVLRIYVIRSGSMEPALHTGATVFVLEGARPSEGDIAAYRLSGSTIVHRVVGETQEGYIFQGDACAQPDAIPVSPSSVVGRVFFSINLTALLFGPFMD